MHNGVSGGRTWGTLSLAKTFDYFRTVQTKADGLLYPPAFVGLGGGVATCGDYPESRGATSPLRMVRVQVPERLLSYV